MFDIESRKEKGQQIAASKKIRKLYGDWVVPSQSGYGVYVVKKNGCSCPDYETHEEKCKHMFAVEFYIKHRKNRDGSVTVTSELIVSERKTYRQDWASYNEAQTREKEYFGILLKNLCSGIEQPLYKGRGKPCKLISEVLFNAVMKVYTTVSARRATVDLNACKEKGLVDEFMHYNTIFNYLEKPEVTAILKNLITESAMPMKPFESTFSMDASGFSTCTYERWFDVKHGKNRSQKKWLKAHIAIGNNTNIVTAVEVTEQEVHDNVMFPALLAQTVARFDVSEVLADKGYLDKKNFQAIVDAGATPYIPFKVNTVAGKGPELWQKLFHFYQYKRPEFLEHYHKRSNVEAAFSMIKRKFGPALRAKKDISQTNELLCKILAHNICCVIASTFELGVEPDFWGKKLAA